MGIAKCNGVQGRCVFFGSMFGNCAEMQRKVKESEWEGRRCREE